jgi:hypothetical protein
MTDEQIIKALKHCYEHKSCNDCVGCLGAEECILNVDPAGDIYPIINRQQAEIERLNNNISAMATTLSNSARETRAEAIKEFAERLKGKFAIFRYVSVVFYSKVISIIDNLVKELEGEGNG